MNEYEGIREDEEDEEPTADALLPTFSDEEQPRNEEIRPMDDTYLQVTDDEDDEDLFSNKYKEHEVEDD